jgi:hypothetical protein
MFSGKTAIAASLLAAGTVLSAMPTASAAAQSPTASCQALGGGVWSCRALNPVNVYRDNAQYGDAPLRQISGGTFRTNCKNDNGNWNGGGPFPNRWYYTTWLGAGGWVSDHDVLDNGTGVQNCPH